MVQRPHRLGVISVSILILVILGLQAVAGLVNTGRWGWPILAYPMYKAAHYDGERLDHDYDLYATFDDGDRVKLGREEMSMSFWIFQRNVIRPILYERPEKLQPVIEHVCARTPSLSRLEAYDLGVAISRDGPVYGLEPELLAAVSVRCY